MTRAQWLFEYESLREKELFDAKQTVETLELFKTLLIHILGLNLLRDEDDENSPEFTPLSLISGRREIIQMILDKLEGKQSIKQAVEDPEFEKMSQAIASGDMEPIMDPDIDGMLHNMNQQYKEEQLKAAGVKITTGKKVAGPHISFDADKMKERARDINQQLAQAKKDVSEQLTKEKKLGYSVSFDDNG